MASLTAPRDKTQRVYDFVMERIVEGEYESGTPLNIGQIAKESGVSLIPAREALRRLESEGLVEFVFHRGVRVAELETSDYRDIMQTLAVLEALAVSKSAPFLTAAELDHARTLNVRMDAALEAEDFHTYNENSLEFHSLLSSRCPNNYLRDTLERGQLRVAAVRAAVVGYRSTIAPQLSREHVDLIDMIAAGAAASEIERVMRAHREATLARDAEGLERQNNTTQ
ncbi:MAG: GntR family transcriptional regulator [Leucobacter sp.]